MPTTRATILGEDEREEYIRGKLEQWGVPKSVIDKMIENYRLYGRCADFIGPAATREVVNFPGFIERAEVVMKKILDELRRLPTVEERRRYILKNAKLSEPGKPGIYAFALPAFFTCPGFSPTCMLFCYAAKGTYKFENAMRTRMINVLATLLPEFRERLRELFEDAVRSSGIKVIRLHDSGNLFTVSWLKNWLMRIDVDIGELEELLGIKLDELPDDKYIQDLAYVISSMPDVRFYTYTRLWQLDDMFRSVERYLLPLKNFTLYLSVDKTMPLDEIEEAIKYSLKHENVKLAFTGFIPEDLLQKYGIRNVVPCPYELARLKGMEGPRCIDCKICIYGRAHVVFPLH